MQCRINELRLTTPRSSPTTQVEIIAAVLKAAWAMLALGGLDEGQILESLRKAIEASAERCKTPEDRQCFEATVCLACERAGLSPAEVAAVVPTLN
jgi:hypothetical protein